MSEAIIFTLLAAVVVIPALLVVTLKNVFHSALWLIVSLTGIGGLYVMLAAGFLFAVQLLVYAGGIMVVLLFVILLSGKPEDWKVAQVNDKAVAAFLFSLFFVFIIATTLFGWQIKTTLQEPRLTTGPLGQLLMNQMVLPFEAISLVLLVSLVGALLFTVKKKS